METLSVIIPVYKVEQYLRQCLDSVVSQTYRDLEILLIDDGSPDHCGQICDAYAAKDARIHVLHQENAGLCAARNAGIDQATGSYLTFVDSDDWLEPAYYENMMQAAQKQQADLVTSNYYRDVGKHCLTVRSFRREETTEDPARIRRFQQGVLSLYFCEFQDWGLAPCWNKLFRRLFVQEHQLYFQPVQTYEDLLYSFQAFRYARRVTCMPACGYHYRYVPSSIVNGYHPERTGQDWYTLQVLYQMGAEQFSDDSIGYRALDAFAVESLRPTVWNIHSRENPLPLQGKLDHVRELLRSEPYRTALNRFLPKSVGLRFRPCAILKTHSACYLYFLSVLQGWKRKLFGVRKR